MSSSPAAMPTPTNQAVRQVALIGNPNTGKSTLFSALVGVRQHVGNYPGVTVEKKLGRFEHDGRAFELIDLPGLYSLAPRSRDEMVATDILLHSRAGFPTADAVICLVDAGNLHRGFYLVSQVIELGLPTVVAVNMLDVARAHGVEVDMEALQRRSPVPVVAVQANRGRGIGPLKAALAAAVAHPPAARETPFPEAFEREVEHLTFVFADPELGLAEGPLPRPLLRRLLLDMGGYLERALLDGGLTAPMLRAELSAARGRLTEEGCAIGGIETAARYQWAQEVLDGVVHSPEDYPATFTDRVDHVLTHRVWGTLVFALLMLLGFQAVFVWAQPAMDGIGALTALLADAAVGVLPEGALRSLLVDGVIGGVGAVLMFLPQIAVLFLLIAVMEDCGYIARAAFLMDRLMAKVGLSGKSFIPMLSSFACAVPGIMAARTIENERDRLTTIMVAPLLTCSARLPIYALLIAAFVPPVGLLGGLLSLQGIVLAALYLLGIVAAVVAALVLKRTILRGETPPLLLELPSYKWPSPRTVLYRVVQRAWHFVRCAGTLILAVSIIIWALLYYPHNPPQVVALERQRSELRDELAATRAGTAAHARLAAEVDELGRRIVGARQRASILGRLGRLIEPVVRPLGWDWRIGCAVLASLPAREVVVATMGVIYNVPAVPGDGSSERETTAASRPRDAIPGSSRHPQPLSRERARGAASERQHLPLAAARDDEFDLESEDDVNQLQQRLRAATWDGSDRRVFNLPVALSILVFYALCAQCAATLGVMRQETGSWRWPALAFTYMTLLAYLGALVTYQGFSALGFHG